MVKPGVGVLTALYLELVIGTPERFSRGKQIASYVGLVPSDESSGNRRRLEHISRQGNALLRFLLVEAAQVTVGSQPQWRNKFFSLAMRRGRKIANIEPGPLRHLSTSFNDPLLTATLRFAVKRNT
jgi:transposase